MSPQNVILNVKPTQALKSAALVAAVLLAGCGQTGPLYLPNPPAAQPEAPPSGATAIPPTTTASPPVSQ